MSKGVGSHEILIQELGGSGAVAQWLAEQTGDAITSWRVAMWYRRGVAWKYRPLLVSLARKKRKRQFIPKDFLMQRSAA